MTEGLPVAPPADAVAPRKSRAARAGTKLYLLGVAVWKFLFGVVLTQSLLGSIAIVGWTMRAAQRKTQQHWWKSASAPNGPGFREFAQGSTFHRSLDGWPNWILEHQRAWSRAHRAPGFGKISASFRALTRSLFQNLKIGVQAVFNTWVLTLPGCVLMLFSWYAGWHNSFNKGYEQAAVGPILGFGGIFLFVAAMYYVPMAQMRQASTGDWRAFFQFKLVWQLIRKRWLMCLGLAMLFTAFSVPVTILKTVPEFFPQINPKLTELPPVEALQFAKTYYFYAAFVLFGAFVVLRLVAARIYASSLLACVQSGALPQEALAESEWETLHRLNLLQVKPEPERHFLVRTIAWLGTKFGRATTGFVLFLVWFSFVAQIYVSEFFMKSPAGRGWLNQPLVQLPWFNYIPGSLKAAAEAGQRDSELSAEIDVAPNP